MAKTALDMARQLYGRGRWKDAIKFLAGFSERPYVPRQTVVAMDAIEGWSWYFLAIGGSSFGSAGRLRRAKEAFVRAWDSAVDKENKVSVLSGLPLVLWQLDRRIEAWKLSDEGTDEFENEAMVWLTRAILLNWDGYREAAVEMLDKAHDTGVAAGDRRTAADARRSLGSLLGRAGNLEDARTAYQGAIELYERAETDDGKPVAFHLEQTKREMSGLSKTGLLQRLVTPLKRP